MLVINWEELLHIWIQIDLVFSFRKYVRNRNEKVKDNTFMTNG